MKSVFQRRLRSTNAAFFALIASACAGNRTSSHQTTVAVIANESRPQASLSSSPTRPPSREFHIGDGAPDFPSSDPNRWVNGTPAMLASARGDVVLVESWHRL